jgi:hypothetical protein
MRSTRARRIELRSLAVASLILGVALYFGVAAQGTPPSGQRRAYTLAALMFTMRTG